MKHRIAQEHHMKEEDEEEIIMEYVENEEIKHLVERSILDDCCMKTTLTKYVKNLIYTPLTYIETIFLCVYQFILMLMIWTMTIKYNIVERFLKWTLMNILSENIIGVISMVINSMIVIQIFEDIWQVIFAFLCKCE
jgi:hypothetical protein